MIDAFLNSVEPPVSDDEDVPCVFQKIQSCKTTSTVSTVVIACKPLTDRLCPLSPLENKLGSFGVFGSIGFICLDKEIRFDPKDIFGPAVAHIIVLTSLFITGGIDRCVAIVTETNCSECIIGMPACLMTQSLMKGVKCTILVAKHPSIHPSAEDAVNLAENLSPLISLPFSQFEIVKSFNLAAPINRKVPLYS